jgi:subtilisin family serine protease
LAANVIAGYTCISSCSAGGVDTYGHGTAVAGVIGATGFNGVGVAGVNWSVKLLPIKFLGRTDGGGFATDAVLALQKVASLRRGGLNIRVVNASWSFTGFSQGMKDAITDLESLGVVTVASAGDDGWNMDIAQRSPAALDNRSIISVLSTDASDSWTPASGYGMGSVDIAPRRCRSHNGSDQQLSTLQRNGFPILVWRVHGNAPCFGRRGCPHPPKPKPDGSASSRHRTRSGKHGRAVRPHGEADVNRETAEPL